MPEAVVGMAAIAVAESPLSQPALIQYQSSVMAATCAAPSPDTAAAVSASILPNAAI